jgi:hypothetical protein
LERSRFHNQAVAEDDARSGFMSYAVPACFRHANRSTVVAEFSHTGTRAPAAPLSDVAGRSLFLSGHFLNVLAVLGTTGAVPD